MKQMKEFSSPYGSRYELISHDVAMMGYCTTSSSEGQLNFGSFTPVEVCPHSRFKGITHVCTIHFQILYIREA